MTAPFYNLESSMNYAPLSGQAILAELNNPESPLYKDLYNARMDALEKKKAREKMVGEMIVAQELNKKIEDLDDKMARAREAARLKSCDDFDKYAEQHKAMMKEIELLGSFKQDPYFAALTSLEKNVQQLVLAQSELAALYAERDEAVRNYEYYTRNDAFVDIFADQVKEGGTYQLSTGKTVSLDTKHLPEERKQEIQAKQTKLITEIKEYSMQPSDTSVERLSSKLESIGFSISEEKRPQQRIFMEVLSTIKFDQLMMCSSSEDITTYTVKERAQMRGIMSDRVTQLLIIRRTTAELQVGSSNLKCKRQEDVVTSFQEIVFNEACGLPGKNHNIKNIYINNLLASGQQKAVLEAAPQNRSSSLRAGGVN